MAVPVDDLRSYALDLADQYGVPRGLVDAIGNAESGWKADALSPKGAIGPMQLMPATAKQLGVDPNNPYDNVRGGVMYLRSLYGMFGGDPALTAAAYNAGPNAVKAYGGVPNYPETQKYVAKVTAIDPSQVKVDQRPEIDPSQVQIAQQEQPKPSGPSPQSEINRALFSGSLFGGLMPDVAYGAASVPLAAAQMATSGWNRGRAAITNGLNWLENKYQQNFDPEHTPGSSLAQGVGSSIATAPLIPAIKPGAGLIKSTLQAGAIGGGVGALQPVQNPGDNFWQQKQDQIEQAAKTGAALNVGGRIIARALSPVVNPQAQMLQQEGVYVPPGQTGAPWLKRTEEKLQSVPLLGDLISSSKSYSLDTFNKSLYARTLAPLGEDAAAYGRSLPVGNEGIAKVGDYLSGSYDSLLNKAVPSPVTTDFVQKTADLAGMLPKSKQQDFVASIQRIVADNMTPAGTLTPSVAKDADSALKSLARQYKGSTDAEQRLLGNAYQQAAANVRSLFAAANPNIAPQINAVNSGWANLTQLETAGARIGSREGVITPPAYLGAVKNSDKTLRDRAFARGEALNQKFAQAADAVLSNRYPDSGTAGRMLMDLAALGTGGGAAFAGMVEPSTLALTSAASIPYLPGIRNLFTSRPNSLIQAGNSLRAASPYLSLPAAGLLGASFP